MIFKLCSFTVLAILLASQALAINLGNVANNIAGIDTFGTPVGNYGAVSIGNNEISGGTLSDLVGGGGNAVTVCFPNILAPEAASFTMTAVGCSGAGTQTVPITASNAQQVCSDLQSLNQGCNWRNQACTHNGSPGNSFDIVGPFLCNLSHWEFLTGTVPAAPSTVNITDVTDLDAADVDYFSIRIGGTLVEANAVSFSSVSNRTQLEVVLENLSGLFNVTLSGNTFTFTTTSTGPITITGLALEFITPATFASVDITGITDAIANTANGFNIRLNSSNANTSGLDFSTVTNGNQLAALLNTVSGVGVSYSGATDTIGIIASAAGNMVFSNIALASIPELGGNGNPLEYTKKFPAVIIDNSFTSGPDGSENYIIINAIIWLDTVTDFELLDFTPSSGISGSYNDATGVLSLTGNATRTQYINLLKTVTYSNMSIDKNPETRQVMFELQDAHHKSNRFTRPINLLAKNFPWILFTPIPNLPTSN